MTMQCRGRFTQIMVAGSLVLLLTSACKGASESDPLNDIAIPANWGKYSSAGSGPDDMTTTSGQQQLRVLYGSPTAADKPGDDDVITFDAPKSGGTATAWFNGRSASWGCTYVVTGNFVGGVGWSPTGWQNKFKDKPRIVVEVNDSGDADNSIQCGGTGTLKITLRGGVAELPNTVRLTVSPSSRVSLTPADTEFSINGGGATRSMTLRGLSPGAVSFSASCSTADPSPAEVSATVVEIAKFIIYADQPGAGGDRDVVEGGDVGHSFWKIVVADSSVVDAMPAALRPYANHTWGYYPSAAVNWYHWEEPGVLNNDDAHGWNARMTYYIDQSHLQAVLQYTKNLNDTPGAYNLSTNNCTDAAIQAAAAAGINVPDTQGSYLGIWTGSNPGDLGEDLIGLGGERP